MVPTRVRMAVAYGRLAGSPHRGLLGAGDVHAGPASVTPAADSAPSAFDELERNSISSRLR